MPVSIRYRIGLVFAILMLGLSPLMYLALLAVPVWLVHLPIGHAHGHFSFLSARIGFGMRPWLFRTMYLQLLLYLLLLLIELALLLAVLRPLFALRRTAVGGVAINSELEPTFCSFVAGICEWMGVAPPKRLEVDCGLNASVHLAPGRWSFFRKDLTLRIGLPVIGALSGRELAGVIAHELGHFRQRTGVRLSFLIRGTNRWLTRAVNDRDALDLWLEREGHDAMTRTGALMVEMASLAIALSRGMLKALMFPSQMASSFLLRQMEYDADRYEVKMAGSKAFETTTRRLALLREAAAKANMEARAMWRIGRHLPDNFPEFVLQYEAKVPIALRDIIDARATRSKTGLFDSYPADGERIRRARAANEAGTFRAEPAGPALFSDFELLAKHATFSYYVEKLGLNLESSNLGPVAAG